MILFRSWPLSIVSLALVAAGACGPALADDVRLDNLMFSTKGGAAATIKHVEFDGTNLTKEEVGELFSSTPAREKLAPIIAKLKAAKILIPEVVVKDDSGSMAFHDFQATGVDAGKVAQMSLAGFDGASEIRGVGQVTMHSGPIAIDGGDFSRLLPALFDGDLASAGPAEVGHFTWQGFSLTFPDKSMPATASGDNLYKIAIASVEGKGTYSGDLPGKGSGELESLTIEPPKASQFGRALAEFGYDRIDISISMSGRYDADAKTYMLDDYTIRGADAGSIDLTAKFGGIGRSAFSGDQAGRLAALAKGNVSSASVSFVNDGLFEKVVGFLAKMHNETAAAIKERWGIMAAAVLPALLGDNPAAPKVAAAVAKFIAAPKKLTITAKAKGGPLAFSEIRTAAPAVLLQRIDLDAVAQ